MADGCKLVFEQTLGQAIDKVEWSRVQQFYKDLSDTLDKNGIDSKQVLAQLDKASSGSEVQSVVDKLLDQVVQKDAKDFARSAQGKLLNASKLVERTKQMDRAINAEKGAVSPGKALKNLTYQSALGTGLNLESVQKVVYSGWAGDKIARGLDTLLGDSNRLMRDPTLRDGVIDAFQAIHLKQPTEKGTATDVAKLIYSVRQEMVAKLNSLGDRNSWHSAGLPTRLDWNLMQGKRNDFVNELALALDEKAHGPLGERANLADAVYQVMEKNKGILDPEKLGQVLGTDTAPALNYASGQAWRKVNDAYGSGNFFDAMAGSIEGMSQRQAAIQLFGPDYRGNFEKMIAWAKDKGATQQDIAEARGAFSQMVDTWVPQNQRLSRALGIARNVKTSAALGGSIFSALTDAPVFVYAMKQFYGAGIFDSIGAMFKSQNAESYRVAKYLGSWSEGLTNHINNRFSVDANPTDRLSQNVAKVTDFTLKLSGIEHWNMGMKSAATGLLRSHLGSFIEDGTKFADLPESLRFQLQRFDIGEGEWNSLGKDHLANGELDIFRLADDQTRGLNLKQKLTGFIQNGVESGILTPGLYDKSLARLGGTPGSVWSEVAKTITMFQSFNNAAWRRVIYATINNPSRDIASKATGLASLMVMGTIAGMIGIQAREFSKGNSLYKWDDPQFITKAVASLPFGTPVAMIFDAVGNDFVQQALGGQPGQKHDTQYGPLAGSLFNAFAGVGGAVVGELRGNDKLMDRSLRGLATELLGDVPGQSLPGVSAVWRSLVQDNVGDFLDPNGYQRAKSNALKKAHTERIGGQLRNFIGQGIDNLTR